MPKHKQSGFTLVEIIVAITVFVVILPAVVATIVTLTTINDKAREQEIINALVQAKTEELRSIGFEGVDAGTTDFTNELPKTIAKPRSASYTVTAPDPSLKEIEITVSYNDRGENRVFTYKTYLGELGAGQY